MGSVYQASFRFPRSHFADYDCRARATSAAPRIFKPLHHEPSKQVYLDGAIYHNNPIQIADKERKLLWPMMQNEHPDMILSIGTTFRPTALLSPEAAASSRTGLFAYGKSLYKIAIDHIQASLDSERAWETYMNVLEPPPEYRNRFVRINPALKEDPPKLDDVGRMRYIQELVREQIRQDSQIQQVAVQLVATCFYFERSGAVEALSDGSYQCKGK